MDPSTVTAERDGHVLRIGLNRPGHRNLFDLDMLTRLAAAYGQLDHDPDLRAGLLFGRGSDFCAGLELAAVSREAHADGLHSVPPGGLDPWQVGGVRLSKPMAAAVHGACITLAVELVLVSDVVVAAESARFAQLEASRGVLPFGGSKEKNNEHQSAFSRHLRHPDPPYAGDPPQGPGDDPTWAPMSSTLITGENEAILIDALMTNGQADALAEWAKSFGKRITGIYITHGHSDHWLGLARLLEHFPEARGFATAEVAARAAWEAEMNKTTQYWTSRFPVELPEAPVVPNALAEPEFELDGHLVRAVSVGQGDTQHSTFFHIPSAEAVVAGDIVYNNIHMMQFETNEEKRKAWIASLDAIAALGPKIVVAGHKRPGSPDLPEHIAASQQYLRDFTRIANQQDTVEDLVAGMMELHGDRDNPHTLWISARAAVANRA